MERNWTKTGATYIKKEQRNRIDWKSALIWGGLALFWLILLYWRFSSWVATYPQYNH